MEQPGPVSNVAYRDVFQQFVHPREEPQLPPSYDWDTQKQHYCPRDLHADSDLWNPASMHQFGYVFCHRGLYDRALRYIDNSNSAIENGLRQGFFLHEVDGFMGRKIHQSFIAHDQTADRVTSKTGLWKEYSLGAILETGLVGRAVKLPNPGLDSPHLPDFGTVYEETPDLVPGLESSLWRGIKQVGLTLQIDLRNEDIARGIAHYAFHLSRYPFQHMSHSRLAWKILRSTMIKGYDKQFGSFEHLIQKVEEEYEKVYGVYGRKYSFKLELLHQLPPIIMVFYSDTVKRLARERDPSTDRHRYEVLRDVFMKHVSSFIGIGDHSYNFILEITHSGLGLLYDVNTGKARNPLTGDPLQNPDVIYESRVDRVMIDVSLQLRENHHIELRKKPNHPNLLFSSCTRLADVIVLGQNYKAHHQDGKFIRWAEGEAGIPAKLRAIHGGLYPQSNLVVADDPLAEIAARTWIDEYAELDRGELLKMPYYEWLRQGKGNTFDAVNSLNGVFLPNKIEVPVDIPAVDSMTPASQVDQANDVILWIEDQRQRFGSAGDERNEDLENQDPASDAALSSKAHQAAGDGNQGLLEKILTDAADAHVPIKTFGDALAAACANGHENIVRLLLGNGVDASLSGRMYGVPLKTAAAYGHDTIVALLLNENGVYIDASGEHESTALAVACSKGHIDTVKLLLDRGADANATVGSDSNVLDEAYKLGHLDICQLLRDAGAQHSASMMREIERSLRGGGSIQHEQPERDPSGRTSRYKRVIRYLVPPLPSCGCILCKVEQRLYLESGLSKSRSYMWVKVPKLSTLR